jgi:Domain of unknown function (DUF4293)
MIQRIQSIYLLLSALCTGSLFLMPFYFLKIAINDKLSNIQEIANDGVFNIYDNKLLLIISALISVFVLAIIFLFKNRSTQKQIVKFAMFFILLFALYIIYLTYALKSKIMLAAADFSFGISFGLGLIGLLGSFLFLLLAMFSIAKDEKIVKSMDRLR